MSVCIHNQTRSSANRGGFRHVQHVPPNRGPHKKWAPTKGQTLSVMHISITPILPQSLTVCFRKAGLKLPVSCCCNSSVHCSTGPQQNVDDDYCAFRVKAVGGERITGYSYIRGPHIFFWTGAPLAGNPALLGYPWQMLPDARVSVSVIPLTQWRHVYGVDWRLASPRLIPNIA